MSPPRLGGVLAVREGWCRADEPVLLCLPVYAAHQVRYDVSGLNWDGRPEPGAGARLVRGIGSAVAGGAFAAVDSTPYRDESPAPPTVVVHGPRPDGLATGLAHQVVPTLRPGGAPSHVVLTPWRLGWVREQPRPDSGGADRSLWERARGLGEGIRDLARDTANAVAGRSDYPAGLPIETVSVAGLAELPRERIAGVGVVTRRYPRTYAPRDGHCLRVSLADGSALDLYVGADPRHAEHAATLAGVR